MVLPPFIDEKSLRIKRDAKRLIDNEIVQGKKVILSVQRFDSKSGHEQLVKSFSLLLADLPNVILLLVGGESFTDRISPIRHNYKKNIELLVSSLGISKNVFFLGNVDYFDLGNLYSISNVVCMLSKMECFGLAITEALSFGKPVVVTRVGGLKLQVIDEVNGFQVDIGDIGKTTFALLKILSDEEIERRFAMQSRNIFEQKFLPKSIINKNMELYLSLCK